MIKLEPGKHYQLKTSWSAKVTRHHVDAIIENPVGINKNDTLLVMRVYTNATGWVHFVYKLSLLKAWNNVEIEIK